MQRITRFLWFNDQAEEAMNFYVSIFPNASAGKIARYTEGAPGPTGSVMTPSTGRRIADICKPFGY